jgi:hypothetical protein
MSALAQIYLGPESPPVCESYRLPSFDSKEHAFAWMARYCPGVKIIRHGRCDFCGKIHLEIKARAPSGDSSGTSRR